jgi:hypothetical protein
MTHTSIGASRRSVSRTTFVALGFGLACVTAEAGAHTVQSLGSQTFISAFPNTAPNNQGTLSFVSRMR